MCEETLKEVNAISLSCGRRGLQRQSREEAQLARDLFSGETDAEVC